MVEANYFDGRSTRIRAVNLSVDGQEIIIAGDGIDLRLPIAEIRVDERLGRAPRRLRLRDGSFCEVRDLNALDTLLSSIGHRDGRVDRIQRQAKYVLIACVAFVILGIASWKWGLPWAAAFGARHLPPAIGEALSSQTLKILDGQILRLAIFLSNANMNSIEVSRPSPPGGRHAGFGFVVPSFRN